jgi:molybdopterin-guanine dinucleotide biosynthesis protein B
MRRPGKRQNPPMKVLGMAGYSGSGKTTLIEKLLPRLREAGLRVAVVKQSHHDFTADVPGKDSWRFRAAGATEVLLTSPYRWMLVHELQGEAEPELGLHLQRLSPCDLVLVEGYKHADLPKLEVWRAANGQPWLHPDDPRFIAVVSDQVPEGRIRHFQLNDIEAILAFLIEYTL